MKSSDRKDNPLKDRDLSEVPNIVGGSMAENEYIDKELVDKVKMSVANRIRLLDNLN